MGFFERLFGGAGGDPAKRTVEPGQMCAKCGQPVPKDTLAFDSGGGRPIHVTCPEVAPARGQG